MFIVKSKNLEITTHYCNSKEVADLVYNYIKNKYDYELELKEVDGVPYFDTGGSRLMNPFLTHIILANIECRIDDLGILIELMENTDKTFKKGFCRIGTFFGNLCFSEKEFQEIKDYIRNNKEEIDKIEKDVEKFWDEYFKQNEEIKSF